MSPSSARQPAPRAWSCPTCGRATQAMVTFAEHVMVLEAANGAITTRTEQRLERRCGWCGSLLGETRPVVVEDLPPL